MIITIDGLSATGKSSVAKRLAHTLGFLYFNTGLIYRMITYVILNKHLMDVEDTIDELNHLDFRLESDQLILEGRDITSLLYTEEIALYTSKYSSIAKIKEWVRKIQRAYLLKGNIIMEGRDIGTRVCPDASLKFYLSASLCERSKRLCARDSCLSLEDAKKELAEIDEKNKASKDFLEPSDAIKIDTTDMSLDEVYEYMLEIIRKQII